VTDGGGEKVGNEKINTRLLTQHKDQLMGEGVPGERRNLAEENTTQIGGAQGEITVGLLVLWTIRYRHTRAQMLCLLSSLLWTPGVEFQFNVLRKMKLG